jgi:UDP-N-acetylglucosamine transferase subunit ALG13
MIFVTLGTNEARFDRILHALDALEIDEELVVQCGASAVRPRNARNLEFLPFDELTDEVRRARVVVMHAGVGSIMVALAAGKRPVVVPRLQRFGEAVDDHQLLLARRLAAAGLVESIEDLTLLPAAIAADAGSSPPPHPAAELLDDLRDYLRLHVQPAAGALAHTP